MNAHDRILQACRKGRSGFKTVGTWGMRQDVKLGGFHGKDSERVPCAVLDLERTKPDPKHFGFGVPIVLAGGETWDDVLAALVAAGELEA
jgi:hypothetical protein